MEFKEKKIRHGVVQCDPMPDDKFLTEYYNKKYYQEGKGSYDTSYCAEELEHKQFEAELIIYALLNLCKEKPLSHINFLELGCGEGFVLDQAKKNHFNITGVDFSRFGLEKFHPHLLDSFKEGDLYDFIEDESKSETFDICVLKNVFEHVLSPERLLNHIHKLLSPNGKLALTVPNDYSVLQNLLLKFELVQPDEWFCPPDHTFYFNTNNIANFLSGFGFSVLDLYTSFPVDVFLLNKHSNYYFDRSKGKEAHYSRIRFELLLRHSGLENTLNVCRAMAKAGVGRNVTVLLRKDSHGG